MTHFYLTAIILSLLAIVLYLIRAVMGPSVFDRLIGLNGITSKVIILLIFVGAYNNQLPMYLDICIGYALLNLVSALAVAKYLEKREVRS
jgi:multicomponent Na+:H+ antiporter subunit F